MFEVPLLLAVIVLVALVFDFTNGAHDCANAIATVVSTKVVTPRFAVGAAALLNLGGALLGTEVAKTLGSGIVNIFLALTIVSWAGTARVVRSQTLSLREKEYVEAARSMGVGSFTTMFRHILPNCLPSLIVLFTLNIPGSILSESSLSFLGIGAQSPATSWGLMVSEGKDYLFTNPVIAIAPGVAILVLALAFNFLGDGVRDVLDPYTKQQ